MKTIFIALAAAAAVPAAALAQPAPVAPVVQDRLGEPGWNGLGRNNVQSRAEVARRARAVFERTDANRDGFITHQEAASARGALRNRVGANGRRQGPRAGMAFDRFDLNRDGAISRTEFEQVRTARQQARARNGETRRARMAGMHGGRFGGRLFAMADANRDQRVSLQEATNAALQRFDQADVNRDGQLTREERQQRRQQMREQRRLTRSS